MKKIFNNNNASSLSDLIFQLISLGYRVELNGHLYSIFAPTSRRNHGNDSPDQQALLSMIKQAYSQVAQQLNEPEYYVLADNVDKYSFEEYAKALIRENTSRPNPMFDVGILVTHKNGFGVLPFETKGMILDREFDLNNRTFYYLVEYYASYMTAATDGTKVAVKMNSWVPEISLGKEPFKSDIDNSVAKLLEQ